MHRGLFAALAALLLACGGAEGAKRDADVGLGADDPEEAEPEAEEDAGGDEPDAGEAEPEDAAMDARLDSAQDAARDAALDAARDADLAIDAALDAATDAQPLGDASGEAGVPHTPLFVMDYASAATIGTGWSALHTATGYASVSWIQAGGPSGHNVHRWAAKFAAVGGMPFDWGYQKSFSGAPFTPGHSVFVRYRFRWVPGTDCRSYVEYDSGSSQLYRNDQLILNSSTGLVPPCTRLRLECETAPLQYAWSLSQCEGGNRVVTSKYTDFGAWHSVQVELRYSSAASVADGAYRLWIDAHAAPTLERSGLKLNAESNNPVEFGAHSYSSMEFGGTIAWEHADFQIDDQFDPNW